MSKNENTQYNQVFKMLLKALDEDDQTELRHRLVNALNMHGSRSRAKADEMLCFEECV